MNSNGTLVISLDFELLWGVFDKVDWKEKKEYFINTRKIIPEMLQLFENYGISCTWATVGMLFNEDWDEWNKNISESLPQYDNSNLSAYNYGRSIQKKESEKFCFAPGLIKRIKETPRQEIGTHTYSHYYCLEPGQTSESFRADLLKSQELALNFGVNLKSLVFPRNQYNKNYLEICRDLGLHTVRTNPEIWYWQNTQIDNYRKKICRTGDAYIGLINKSYKDISKIHPKLTGQKSSRFLRPNGGVKLLDKIRLIRIQHEMSEAAKMKKIYHLWWHPHNFGTNPKKSLEELNFLLGHFKFCQNKYGMESCNMIDVSSKGES